ncbi:hypothetical protein ABIA23_003316 [Sinorhizobium fredii]
MTLDAEKLVGDFGIPGVRSGYEVNYCFGQQGPTGVVKDTSLAELFHHYADILWDEGHHKYNVKAFIGELDEILLGARFSTFSQDLLDNLIGALRKRGNSNATINRKMSALSKLLRKAYKMGEIHVCRSSGVKRREPDGCVFSNPMKRKRCSEKSESAPNTSCNSRYSWSIQAPALARRLASSGMTSMRAGQPSGSPNRDAAALFP